MKTVGSSGNLLFGRRPAEAASKKSRREFLGAASLALFGCASRQRDKDTAVSKYVPPTFSPQEIVNGSEQFWIDSFQPASVDKPAEIKGNFTFNGRLTYFSLAQDQQTKEYKFTALKSNREDSHDAQSISALQVPDKLKNLMDTLSLLAEGHAELEEIMDPPKSSTSARSRTIRPYRFKLGEGGLSFEISAEARDAYKIDVYDANGTKGLEFKFSNREESNKVLLQPVLKQVVSGLLKEYKIYDIPEDDESTPAIRLEIVSGANRGLELVKDRNISWQAGDRIAALLTKEGTSRIPYSLVLLEFKEDNTLTVKEAEVAEPFATVTKYKKSQPKFELFKDAVADLDKGRMSFIKQVTLSREDKGVQGFLASINKEHWVNLDWRKDRKYKN